MDKPEKVEHGLLRADIQKIMKDHAKFSEYLFSQANEQVSLYSYNLGRIRKLSLLFFLITVAMSPDANIFFKKKRVIEHLK